MNRAGRITMLLGWAVNNPGKTMLVWVNTPGRAQEIIDGMKGGAEELGTPLRVNINNLEVLLDNESRVLFTCGMTRTRGLEFSSLHVDELSQISINDYSRLLTRCKGDGI